MPEPDTEADLALLVASVREAGEIARSYYGGDYRRWHKDKGSPVTECDLAIDRYLSRRLRAARPHYGWLSEETDDNSERLSTQTVFVVDPIDGTVAFMKNRPHFSICAAVVHRNHPVSGAVYNPITDECFTAREGHGAYCNGLRLKVSDRTRLEGCRMLADRAMLEHQAWNEPPNRPWPPMHIESRSSIAYRMALVARGEFDALLALSPKRDWDLAAAEIVLAEAGGISTAHDGSKAVYNLPDAMQTSIVAAGPALHDEIMRRIGHIALPRR